MKKGTFLSMAGVIFITLSSFLLPLDGYKVGDKAMIFNLKNIDGKLVSLGQDASAKGYIVVFTCNTCPVAKAYEERVLDLHTAYAAKGFPVIAINSNDASLSPGDSYEQMQQRAKSKDYKFPYLIDETQEVAKTYGARSTPTVYVLKKNEKEFTVAYMGAIDNNSQDASAATVQYVKSAVESLLADKPVEIPSAKAVGCGIKWRKM